MKSLNEYRERKRQYAKTAYQRIQRTKYMRVWRAKHRDRHNELARQSHQRNKHKHVQITRSRHLQRTFGISEQNYIAILEQQGGGCAICKKRPSKWHFPIDHCHATGKIRGILCTRCNVVLGNLEKVGLQRFYGYLVNSDH